MGHLSTIIGRVEQRLKDYNGDEEKASKDPYWRQSIGNLQEYQAYGDYTAASLHSLAKRRKLRKLIIFILNIQSI